MRFFFTLFFLSFYGLIATAQSPDFAWAREIGQTGITTGCLLAIDGEGNSFVAGAFGSSGTNQTLTLGSTVLVHPGPGGASQFIAKFDPSGQVLWAKKISIAGVQDENNPDKMVVDAEGNLYITGTFQSGSVWDTLTVPPVEGGSSYGLVKFDPNGHVQWLRMTDTPDHRIGTSSALNIDAQGGQVSMSGLFNTKIFFHTGDSLVNTDTTSTGVDAFYATYDAQGNLVGLKRLGVVNTSANPNWNYTVEFFREDIHKNIYRLAGNRTIVKYAPDGTVLLSKTLSMTGAGSELKAMAVDPAGNVFLCGWFYQGSITVEGTLVPKVGNTIYTDALLIKLNAADLSLAWLKSHNYAVNDSYEELRTDELGNLYVSGGQSTAVGDAKGLMQKYTNEGSLLWQTLIEPGATPVGGTAGQVRVQNIVQAHNGGNILVVGRFQERIYFDPTVSFSVHSGGYKMFIAQYGQCNTPVPLIDAPSGFVFCEGDSLMLSSASYPELLWSTGETTSYIYATQPGTYYVSAVENQECYARSLPVNLIVLPYPLASVTVGNASFAADSIDGDYQWIDCDNNIPIPGATGQIFHPNANGNYAVIVTNTLGCADTSACYPFLGVGIDEGQIQPLLTLFPNPASDRIHLSGTLKIQSVNLFTHLGQQIRAEQGKTDFDISTLPPGTYYIIAETEKGTWRGRFVKR